MSTLTLDVELFECVPAAADTVLLRLEGRWHAPTREPLPMPTLVVDDGRASRRLAALPGPDALPPHAGPEPELWRATYPASADLLDDPRIAFALDAGRGQIIDLPAAAPRGSGRRFSRSSHAELAHERTLRASAERLADDRRRALRDAESSLDRERAARAAETVRADAAEADLARAHAELESAADHRRADAAQHARDMEAAAGALAAAQARVRELEEALSAQRHRALAAESAATSAAEEAQRELAHEQQRSAEALAAQRALAEEATRARIAAEAQAREHIARAADLERSRDELRGALEAERDTLRALQARGVGDLAVEERRRVRELQQRVAAAERRAEQAERRLTTEEPRATADAGLAAEATAQRARADEAQRQVRQMAEELVQAAQLRTELQDELAAARADAPVPDTTALEEALAAERSARQRAEQEARLAIEERAELERRAAAADARRTRAAEPVADAERGRAAQEAGDAGRGRTAHEAAAPEPVAPRGRAVFGPFGDAGPVVERDPPTAVVDAPAPAAEIDDLPWPRSRGWEHDEFDAPAVAGTAAEQRALARREAHRARALRRRDDAGPAVPVGRALIVVVAVVAAGALLGLKVSGLLGALVLASS